MSSGVLTSRDDQRVIVLNIVTDQHQDFFPRSSSPLTPCWVCAVPQAVSIVRFKQNMGMPNTKIGKSVNSASLGLFNSLDL
jgi:hypothetical protein